MKTTLHHLPLREPNPLLLMRLISSNRKGRRAVQGCCRNPKSKNTQNRQHAHAQSHTHPYQIRYQTQKTIRYQQSYIPICKSFKMKHIHIAMLKWTAFRFPLNKLVVLKRTVSEWRQDVRKKETISRQSWLLVFHCFLVSTDFCLPSLCNVLWT